jgi:hypothetical protein
VNRGGVSEKPHSTNHELPREKGGFGYWGRKRPNGDDSMEHEHHEHHHHQIYIDEAAFGF